MWHLSKIPKLLHIYWGGRRLSYMRFLTVKSFLKYNPDWKVIFWSPAVHKKGKYWQVEDGHEEIDEKLLKDYLPQLLRLPIVKATVDFDNLNMARNVDEVHKCDYIRINALHNYGGVWSDMDVIYFKPLASLKVNTEANKDKSVFVCIGPYGHSTGFCMAAPESQFFNKLADSLKKNYRPQNYQCWGPDIFNKYFPNINSIPGGVNLDMDVVYAHDCYHVKELLNGASPRFSEGSIGCHWYGGNSIWGKFMNETKGGIKNLPDCIMSNLIRDAK